MREQFLARVASAGLELQSLTPETGIRLMLEWYLSDRIEGCDVSEDGDMLLYQWGTGWQQELFSINITRQLLTGDGDDEDIFQLSLTFKFAPHADTSELDSENFWCLVPEEAKEFLSGIESSEAMQATRKRRLVEIELHYGCAG